MNTRLTGISSMATRQVLAELADAWRHSGGEVVFESVGGVEATQRVLGGEDFDLVVLAAEAIDKLVAAGRIVAGSRMDLVRSAVAIAVRKGSPRPAIGTEAALREALMSARTIGFSTGPSGTALQQNLDRWGILETLRPRLVQAQSGVPVGELIVRGDVELGFQQLSELIHLDGVDVIGPMPPGLEIVTTFSGGLCAGSAHPDAVRALLDYIGSPAADEAKRRHGMQPA